MAKWLKRQITDLLSQGSIPVGPEKFFTPCKVNF